MLVAFGPASEPTNEVFVRVPYVEHVTGASFRHIKRWEADGKFPQSKLIGPRMRVWRKSDIERWMSERFAEADTQGEYQQCLKTKNASRNGGAQS